jgi:tetratricopeptide (TPR) repeat protein
VLLYLIGKVAAAGLGPVPAIAAAPLPPADPVPVMRQLIGMAQNQKVKISPDAIRTVRQGLADSPLAFEPFFIAARAEEQAGRLPRAIALMEEARRRRPTFAANRMQLLVYYAQAQRFDGALRELDVLLRRNAELQKVMLPEVVKFMKDPAGRRALADLLAREPEWREAFFQVAAAQKVDPADARSLFALVQARKKGGNLDLERQLILQAQVSNGEFGAARATALAALPAAERPANQLLIDANFRGLKVPKPFGWELRESEPGRAEFAREGGRSFLDVAYFGGSNAILAEQTLALAPGRYTLTALVRRDGPANGGRLFWQVNCAGSPTPIGTLDMSPATPGGTRVTSAFTVPGGCAGQNLFLIAEPGEIASTVTLQVSGLELRR